MQDGCGSTRTRVKQGSVNVRDDVRKRTIILRRGKTYTARPRSGSSSGRPGRHFGKRA